MFFVQATHGCTQNCRRYPERGQQFFCMGRKAQRPCVSVGDNNLARRGKDQQHFCCLCSLDPFVRASALNVNHITFPWKYKQAHPADGCLPSGGKDLSVLAPFSLRSVLGQNQYWTHRQILAVSSWKEMTVLLPGKKSTVSQCGSCR